MVLFPDYTRLVLADYEKKRLANMLSLRLSQPTTAKIKEQSIAVCRERYSHKDRRILNDFFGVGNDEAATMKTIEKCDPDKFKPLLNFLKGKTATTDPKNVELLAWLIDFNLRPYEYGKSYVEVKEEDIKTEAVSAYGENILQEESSYIEQQATEKEKLHVPYPSPPASRRNFKITAFLIVAALVLTGSLFVFQIREDKSAAMPLKSSFTNREGCMYWAGDHYEQISCTQKLGDTLVVALDSEMLLHFKKITLPDTITNNSKGKIWYVKINGEIEFYTSEGYHPVYRQLRLKPITDYIINKYIHPVQ